MKQVTVEAILVKHGWDSVETWTSQRMISNEFKTCCLHIIFPNRVTLQCPAAGVIKNCKANWPQQRFSRKVPAPVASVWYGVMMASCGACCSCGDCIDLGRPQIASVNKATLISGSGWAKTLSSDIPVSCLRRCHLPCQISKQMTNDDLSRTFEILCAERSCVTPLFHSRNGSKESHPCTLWITQHCFKKTSCDKNWTNNSSCTQNVTWLLCYWKDLVTSVLWSQFLARLLESLPPHAATWIESWEYFEIAPARTS